MSLKLQEENYVFTDLIIKVANIFGVAPWYDVKNQKFFHLHLFKLYGTLLTVLTIALTLLSGYYIGHQMRSVSQVLPSLNLILTLTSVLLFLVSVLGSAFWNNKPWQGMLTFLFNAKHQVKLNGRFFMNFSFIYFALGTTQTFVVFGFTILLMGIAYTKLICSTIILLYAKFVIVCLMYTIISALNNKYKVINDNLNEINLCVVVKTNTVKKLKEAAKRYMDAYEIVELFNKIFGWPLLLVLAESVALVLLSLALLTEHGLKLPSNEEISNEAVIFHVYSTLISLFQPILIIFSCDAVVQESNKLIKKCCKLQENLPMLSKDTEELERLRDLIQNKPPVFTAANFFEIRRSTVLSLISTITTYMIVILQYNYL